MRVTADLAARSEWPLPVCNLHLHSPWVVTSRCSTGLHRSHRIKSFTCCNEAGTRAEGREAPSLRQALCARLWIHGRAGKAPALKELTVSPGIQVKG